jgi:hypothetical protein
MGQPYIEHIGNWRASSTIRYLGTRWLLVVSYTPLHQFILDPRAGLNVVEKETYCPF